MIETLAAPTTTVKSGKYGPFNQTKREVQTRWVLNPESEPKVVVELFTSHRPESKTFSTTLTWGRLEERPMHPRDGEGIVSIWTWASDHKMVTVHRTPVARYSVKAMEAHHAEALEIVKEEMASGNYSVMEIFSQASAAVLPEEV